MDLPQGLPAPLALPSSFIYWYPTRRPSFSRGGTEWSLAAFVRLVNLYIFLSYCLSFLVYFSFRGTYSRCRQCTPAWVILGVSWPFPSPCTCIAVCVYYLRRCGPSFASHCFRFSAPLCHFPFLSFLLRRVRAAVLIAQARNAVTSFFLSQLTYFVFVALQERLLSLRPRFVRSCSG